MSVHRSLTIRVPVDTYLEVAELASADGENLNSKFNHLILLGLDKHVSLDAALLRLIKGAVLTDV